MDAETKDALIDAVPGRHCGDPCFSGTRVPVSTMFECLAGGDSLSAFLAGFPSVSTEQARFALREAADSAALGEVVAAQAGSRLICAMPDRLGSEAYFTGTGVPVRDLFAHLRGGLPLDAFLARCPGVTREQTEFALRMATEEIERDYGLPAQRMPEQEASAPAR